MASIDSEFATRRLLRFAVIGAAMICALAFSATVVLCQDYLTASGTPTFVAPQPLEQGFTDEANGNLHLEFVFGSYPQRASNQPLAVRYVYDSNMVWVIGCSGSGCSWAPNNSNGYGWRLATNTGTLNGLNCGGSGCSEWVYTDSVGTNHYFEVTPGTCPVPNAYASDSSGYMLNICQTGIYAPDGSLVYSAQYEQPTSPGAEDTNGNYASWYSVAGATDTLGRPLPGTIINCNGNSSETCYTVPNSQYGNSGGTSTYTVTTATIGVKTAFGQSGVSEFTGNMNVVQSITLPDGTSYTFKYDCDSSTSSACGSPPNAASYYGLPVSMTVPTGGIVYYGWNTFSDSYSSKVRWLIWKQSSLGGTWSYTPQVISTCGPTDVGCQQKVTVAKPSGDSTIYTFTLNNGAWPVQIESLDSSSNVLSTVNNTYDFSQPCPFQNCHGAAFIRLLTTQTTVSTPSGSITNQTALTYDSPQTGNVTAKKEWGYYAGTSPSFPSVPDRATYTNYLTTGTNDINRPTSATLCNNSGSDSACPGGGSRVSQTLYTYDNYSACGLSNVSGVMNHDDTNFGSGYTERGNATSIQQWVSGSSYLTTTRCYDTTGQVTQETDAAGVPTSYSYSDRFYTDTGSNSLQSYAPSKPTNAYVTSITQPIIGTSTSGYYYGSGNQAFATDPNGATSYAHFMDPFDRSTEHDYAYVGWDKSTYPSANEIEISGEVGEQKQTVLDGFGRDTSDRITNYPGGESTVDTVYDLNGRVRQVSHPYQSSGEVYESYTYDGLDRTTQNTHPDSQYVAAFYGPSVSPNGGVSAQQGSVTTYGWGYPVLYRDEVGKLRQEWLDGFGRVIEVDEPSADNSQSSGSITINGSERSTVIQKCLRWLQGGDCERWENETVWDTGTVSITVDGVGETVNYGSSSTSSTIASALASAFNGNGNSPVTASASSNVITFLSKASGPGTEYGFTASSQTNDPNDFGGPSFYPSPTSGALTNDGATGSLSTPVATFYQYDAADHVVKVVQGVQTRTYVYDGLGRPVSITTPEAGTVTLAYTNSGALCSGDPENVCQRTDARGVQTYYYFDQLNRLTGKGYTIPGGSNVAAMPNVCTTQTGQSANVCFNYDQGGAGAYALGRRTQMLDPSGSETYTYDAAGRITQLIKTVGSNSYTIGYQYNAGDELTQIAYPSGRVVQLSYNAVGQTCEIAPSTSSCGSAASPYATGYTYNAAGQLVGFRYGNGIYGSFGYSSNRSQMNCLDYSTTNRGGTCTHDSTSNFGLNYYYAQDPNYCANGTPGDDGKIECSSDATSTSIVPGANGRTAAYSYDALGRLSTASTTGSPQFPQWGLSESYDQYGNRWSQAVTLGTGPMSSLSFGNPGGAQTNQPDGWCFDASGNLLAKSGACPPAYPNFVYDGENRMVGDPTANWTYVYDGNGTRVEKCTPNCSSPSSSVVYIFSGSQDIAEYSNGAGAGSPSTEFVYSDAIAGSGLLASISNGSVTYFQSDHLNWRVATNSSGGITGSQGHFPFGESWYSSSANEFVFTSYQRDSESGLDYAMARYYDSSAGRMCSADPVGGDPNDPQSWNRYTYARNDPIDITDPNGQFWLWDVLKIVGMVISGAFTGGVADVAEAAGNDILATILGMETAGSMVFTDRMMMNEGQQGQQLPQHLPQPSVKPSYCDPAVMAGMQAAWNRVAMPNVMSAQTGSDRTEAGFPVYSNGQGGYTVGNDASHGPKLPPGIQVGDATGFGIKYDTAADAIYHTHPSGTSGLPSTKSNHAGEGTWDTQSASSNNIDIYVISDQGLSVASKTDNPNIKFGGKRGAPPPWIVQGNGVPDWLKKLKKKCGQ